MRALLLLALWGAWLQPAIAAEATCRTAEPFRIRVRFAGEAARDLLVESTLPSGIQLRDAASPDPIWSAGPDTARTQQFAGMDAPFGTSFAAVHLDADGLHDLLYAGDRAGRVWRFDLRSGARPTSWMQATVIAELGAPGGGRGFIAPPDATLIAPETGPAWLNIALGTATIGEPRTDHRFYVLRDSIAERRMAPLVESDLERLSPPAGIARSNTSGYYLPLGSAQVLAQALTLNGRIHFVAVENARSLLAACASGTLPAAPVALSVTVLRAEDGTVEPDGSTVPASNGPVPPLLRRPLPAALPASAGVVLATAPADANGHVPCMVGDQRLPACSLDTRPRRSWWRREDAD